MLMNTDTIIASTLTNTSYTFTITKYEQKSKRGILGNNISQVVNERKVVYHGNTHWQKNVRQHDLSNYNISKQNFVFRWLKDLFITGLKIKKAMDDFVSFFLKGEGEIILLPRLQNILSSLNRSNGWSFLDVNKLYYQNKYKQKSQNSKNPSFMYFLHCYCCRFRLLGDWSIFANI